MKPSYQTAYIASAVLLLINVAIGAIQAVYASGHGADLGINPQVQAWLAVISTVLAAALALLPQIQRTPGTREAKYLLASQGRLPDDLAARYPIVATVAEPPVTSSTPTSVHTEPPA